MGKGQKLYKKAKTLIPGGTQLLSKRPEMFLPDYWPAYYSKAKGIDIWDLDNKHYLDMSIMGVGACILGYADPDVDQAVHKAIDNGSMATLNCPEEVELAELLCQLHPWADMIRYARSGGEAMAIAVRIARTATGRNKVAICGYHGWHDWYISANLGNNYSLDGYLIPGLSTAGVPQQLRGSTLAFSYQDRKSFDAIIAEHKDDLAAIIMEPARGHEASPEFLKYVQKEAKRVGTVFVFDEINSVFRMCAGGIHLRYGVNPDIAVFAKAISNGYPLAVVIGKRSVMDEAQRSFISSTNWTERIGPTAAIATIKKYLQKRVDQHIIEVGNGMLGVWKVAAQEAGLKIHAHGLPTLGHFDFEGDNDLKLRTLFTQLMLERGYLAWCQFKVSYAHQEEHLKKYKDDCAEVFSILKKAQEQNRVEEMLKGTPSHQGFKRLVS